MREKRKLDPEKEKHWRSIMEKFRSSEMTFRNFCAAENISPNTFQFWQRELRLRDEAAGVVSSISKGENKPLQVEANLQYWRKVIAELKVHKGNRRTFCAERGITSGNLHYWQTKLKSQEFSLCGL